MRTREVLLLAGQPLGAPKGARVKSGEIVPSLFLDGYDELRSAFAKKNLWDSNDLEDLRAARTVQPWG